MCNRYVENHTTPACGFAYALGSVAVPVVKDTTSKPSLIEGRRMTCPRCKGSHDILQYVPMQQVQEYATETNPIYKCPTCRWIFSPAPHVLEDLR